MHITPSIYRGQLPPIAHIEKQRRCVDCLFFPFCHHLISGALLQRQIEVSTIWTNIRFGALSNICVHVRWPHKLFYTKYKVVLKSSGKHTLSSHIQDNSKQNLLVVQTRRSMLRISVKCAPTATGREHAHNTSNFSPGKRTPRDSYALRSAQRLVSKERWKLALKVTGGVHLNSDHGKF